MLGFLMPAPFVVFWLSLDILPFVAVAQLAPLLLAAGLTVVGLKRSRPQLKKFYRKFATGFLIGILVGALVLYSVSILGRLAIILVVPILLILLPFVIGWTVYTSTKTPKAEDLNSGLKAADT